MRCSALCCVCGSAWQYVQRTVVLVSRCLRHCIAARLRLAASSRGAGGAAVCGGGAVWSLVFPSLTLASRRLMMARAWAWCLVQSVAPSGTPYHGDGVGTAYHWTLPSGNVYGCPRQPINQQGPQRVRRLLQQSLSACDTRARCCCISTKAVGRAVATDHLGNLSSPNG